MTKEEFIENCNRQAIEAIMEFIDKMGILVDGALITDQLNIPVNIGELETAVVSAATAEYDSEHDIITVNEREFDREELQNFDNPNVNFYFTKAIVHERIHSLRRRISKKQELDRKYKIGLDESLLSNKFALEEYTTEALALMITTNYMINKNFTLDQLVEKAIKISQQSGEEVAAILIREMGEPFIEWFLTTRYQNNCIDEFALFLGDDYELLCDNLTALYDKQSDDSKKAKEIEKIILNRSNSKKTFPTSQNSIY